MNAKIFSIAIVAVTLAGCHGNAASKAAVIAPGAAIGAGMLLSSAYDKEQKDTIAKENAEKKQQEEDFNNSPEGKAAAKKKAQLEQDKAQEALKMFSGILK